MRPNLRRTLRAQWRDIRVLLKESQTALIVFVLLIVLGGYLLYLLYTFPAGDVNAGRHLSFMQALHTTLAMIFFQIMIPFPDRVHAKVVREKSLG